MISVKYILIILCLTFNLQAEDIPFSVSGSPEVLVGAAPGSPTPLDSPDTQAVLISKLKLQAVTQWLQGELGNRFNQFQGAVNQDFAEKHVLHYKLSKNPADPNVLELSGFLDGDSLKRWIRLQDVKKGGTSQVRAVMLFSSNLANFTFNSSETHQKKNHPLINYLSQSITTTFQKLSGKIAVPDSAPTLKTPKTNEDSREFREWGLRNNANAGLWVNLNTCQNCSGIRLDLFFLSFHTARSVFILSEEIALKSEDLNDTVKIKAALAPFIQLIQSNLDTAISDGSIEKQEYKLKIEGIENIKNFKWLDKELMKLGFIQQLILKRVDNTRVEYSYLSALSTDEISRRIQSQEFTGFKLLISSIDSGSLVMRYSK